MTRSPILASVLAASALSSSPASAQGGGVVRVQVEYVASVVALGAERAASSAARYTVGAVLDGTSRVVDSWEGTSGSRQRGRQTSGQVGQKWRVLGRNQLQRVTDWPNSQTTVTVTTSGDTCRATVESRLKPGQTVYRFRTLSTGGYADFRDIQYTDIRCSITTSPS